MTASNADRSDDGAGRVRLVSEVTDASVEATARPMPRLGRGIVWSDIVAEIERDHDERLRIRDAA